MTPTAGVQVGVLGSADSAAVEAARLIAEAAGTAVAKRGRFVLALCGGSTPAELFRVLAAPAASDSMRWSDSCLVWGDERCVSPEDERSNYRLATDSGLLRRPWAGIHRMPGELPPEEGALAYEETLRALFGPGEGPPAIDVVLLGLGEDGHTASLFPGSPALGETRHWVTATEPQLGTRRLTLTPPVLQAARLLLFLVTGAVKASIVGRVLHGAEVQLPAARVMRGWLDAPHRVVWLLDREAAGSLGSSRRSLGGPAGLDAGTRGVVYVLLDPPAQEVPLMPDQDDRRPEPSPPIGETKELLDAEQLRRTLVRMAHEIAEDADIRTLALVGIQRRGVELAERLATYLEESSGHRPPTGSIDITFYRDDVGARGPVPGHDLPVVRSTSLPFAVHGRRIVLVDDVLFTGRTIRAAIEALFDYGRPEAVRLAVLIDRGHRELPIRPDFVGKNVPTSRTEDVIVHLAELDGVDSVVLERR